MKPFIVGILGCTGLFLVAPARADEVEVLATVAMKPALEALTSQFKATAGHTLRLVFKGSPTAAREVAIGQATPDVLIVSGDSFDEPVQNGKIVPTSQREIARTRVAAAARKGAPQPDFSSAQTVKAALLQANSIAYADPALGSPTGLHMPRIMERLGIAAEMKAKTRVVTLGFPIGDLVAKGEVELGFQQLSELLPSPGIEIIPLPPELQNYSSVRAGMTVAARSPVGAKVFLEFLVGTPARKAIQEAGLDLP